MVSYGKQSSAWMNETLLWPVEDAPTDGSVIVAVYDDASGVAALRYGLPQRFDQEKYRPGWWSSDWEDYHGEDLSGFMGWIMPPQEISWRESV